MSSDARPDESVDPVGWGAGAYALFRAYGWLPPGFPNPQPAPARLAAGGKDKPRRKKTRAFKQADVKRAIAAAQPAGVAIGGVEIDPTGKISITGAPAGAAVNNQPVDEFEQWKARRVVR